MHPHELLLGQDGRGREVYQRTGELFHGGDTESGQRCYFAGAAVSDGGEVESGKGAEGGVVWNFHAGGDVSRMILSNSKPGS